MNSLAVFQVYDLGADGQGMSRVATMSQSTIVAAAGNIARYVGGLLNIKHFYFTVVVNFSS